VIKADGREIADLARSLQKTARDVPAAFDQVAQRVAKQTGPIAVDEITAIYNLSDKRTESAISARAQGPVIFTIAKSRGVTLKEFGGEKYAKGYQAQIKRGKPRRVRGGFTAKAKYTGELPFKRVGKSRYPIKVLYGPKVSSMIRNREVAPRFAVRQAGVARAELTRQMLDKLDRM
jgi:hypothetical protein